MTQLCDTGCTAVLLECLEPKRNAEIAETAETAEF